MIASLQDSAQAPMMQRSASAPAASRAWPANAERFLRNPTMRIIDIREQAINAAASGATRTFPQVTAA